jgi:flagellar hook-associated protein 1 FlgK
VAPTRCPGLFTWNGFASGDTIPGTGTVVPGLSALIKVNDNLVKSKGGDPTLLRDGGYDVDNLGVASSVFTAMSATRPAIPICSTALLPASKRSAPFDSVSMLDTSTTIGEFATASVGWLEQLISESATAKDNKQAQLTRVVEALSNTTGVSLDEEMSLMLDLEQSYKASSKLVATVDEMIQALLAAVG